MLFETLAKWINVDRSEMGSSARHEAVAGGLAVDPHRLPVLPGIDTRAGLATTQGGLALYRRLLARFRDNQREFEHQFRTTQAQADLAAARRLAHTLKGVAGTIGARGVQASAHALEMACQERSDGIEDRLRAVMAELRPVLAGLEALPAAEEGKGERLPDGDPVAVSRLLLPVAWW